jgi:NAD(P)-dependent dehydrogenase (short-subunit alcohol dehydrogenase family)
MELTDQVVLVTGAASGIGRASAEKLARLGARVVVVDRDGEGAERTAAAITNEGASATSREVDVGDREAVDRLVADTLAAHTTIDALVHCAATNVRANLLELSDDDWHHVIRVNLDGSFWLGRAVGRVMADAGRGTMIFLTSDRGTLGAAEGAAYAASKGGLIALVKSLALALAPAGVTVNGINPGTTDTPMARSGLSEEQFHARAAQDPLGRLSRPEEIAEIVAFLCGPASGFMTGQIVTTRMR